MRDQRYLDAKSAEYQKAVPATSKRMIMSMRRTVRRARNGVYDIVDEMGGNPKEMLSSPVPSGVIRRLADKISCLPKADATRLTEKLLTDVTEGRLTGKRAVGYTMEIERIRLASMLSRDMSPAILDTATRAYNHSLFAMQKAVGLGYSLGDPPKALISRVTHAQLSQTMMLYSADSIIKPLKKTLMQGLAKGYTAEKMAVELSAVSSTSVYKSKAMIRTAITEVANEMERRTSMDMGMTEYEYVATLDERTCPVCGGMDGKIANLKSAEAGVNFPPMHKNCRCVTTAVLNDKVKSEMTRRARDAEGHSQTVPATMTYEEWAQKFGSDRARAGLEKTKAEDVSKLKVPDTGPKYVRDVPTRERRTVTTSDFGTDFTNSPKKKKNTERMVAYLNNKEEADPNAVAVIQNLMANKDTPDFTIRYSDDCKILPDIRKPKLEIPDQSDPKRKTRMGSVFHEMTHMADFFHRKNKGDWRLATESDDALTKAIKSTPSDIPEHTAKLFADYKAEQTRLRGERNANRDEWRGRIEVMLDNRKGDKDSLEACKAEIDKYNEWAKISSKDLDDGLRSEVLGGGVPMLEDIYDALSGGAFYDSQTVLSGHGIKYYRVKGNKEAELIANYTSLSIERPDLIAQLRKDKPDLCKELDRIMYELGE